MIARVRPPHRGLTLIETMVMISVLAILLGLAAVTMQVLMRLGGDTQSRRAAASAMGRLAERFREDVHACDDAEPRPPAGLRLRPDPRRSIDYEVQAGRVVRAETVDGQPGRRETYALDRHETAAFERRDDGPRSFLALVIRRTDRPGGVAPPHPMEVLALIGKARPGGGPPR